MTFPDERPVGLRRDRTGGSWWRIDHEHPSDWDWTPFTSPRHRFDPDNGGRRVRYAGRSPLTAALEALTDDRSINGTTVLVASDMDRWLVRLDGSTRPELPLTHQQNLTVLGLDDRISTGRLGRRPDPLLDTCWALGSAVDRWWPDDPTAIRFRSRRHPSSTNLAFPRIDPDRIVARRLGDATRLLTTLKIRHRFAVQ